MKIAFLSTILVLVLAVCVAPAASRWQARLGTIEPDLRPLELPEEIRAGLEFTVTVRTVGSSSCTAAAGVESAVEGMRAVIRPIDRVAPDGSICTMDLASFPRQVTLVFPTPGEGEIVVVAHSLQGDTVAYALPVEVRG
jgi:hypothetical protein